MSKTSEALYQEARVKAGYDLSAPQSSPYRGAIDRDLKGAARRLPALDHLLEACAELSDEQLLVFEEAATRRPLFVQRA